MSAMRVAPDPKAPKDKAAGKWPEVEMSWAIGLRNPGRDYEGTRHNAGADALARVALGLGVSFAPDKSLSAEVAKAGDVGLALPVCWMNESAKAGGPVAKRAGSPQAVVVLHDDIELAPGEARLKFSGGYAGHNGLRSLGGAWGGPDFVRVRIGVGRPDQWGSKMTVADWALSRPSRDHAIAMAQAYDRVAQAFDLMREGRWEDAAAAVRG